MASLIGVLGGMALTGVVAWFHGRYCAPPTISKMDLSSENLYRLSVEEGENVQYHWGCNAFYEHPKRSCPNPLLFRPQTVIRFSMQDFPIDFPTTTAIHFVSNNIPLHGTERRIIDRVVLRLGNAYVQCVSYNEFDVAVEKTHDDYFAYSIDIPTLLTEQRVPLRDCGGEWSMDIYFNQGDTSGVPPTTLSNQQLHVKKNSLKLRMEGYTVQNILRRHIITCLYRPVKIFHYKSYDTDNVLGDIISSEHRKLKKRQYAIPYCEVSNNGD